jgi:transcriptional regulator with XRE-family HTH domain
MTKQKNIQTKKRIPGKNNLLAGRKANFFGQTLKELRLQKDLTQGEAAGLVELSQAQWSGYEKGSSRPTLDTIINIAVKLEIEPLVLIGKTLDKFRFPKDPYKELTFSEYDRISKNVIENYRNTRLQFKLEKV